MRPVFAVLLSCAWACGGPTQSQIVETPSATAPARHKQAPPASTSDEDRYGLNQQFEDMETTQRAYREAGQANRKGPPPPPPRGQPGTKAPVEQAPAPAADDDASSSAPTPVPAAPTR